MPRRRPVLAALVGVLVLLGAAGCGGEDEAGAASAPGSSSAVDADQRYPDVEAVDISREDDGTYTLDVTISSPYDTPERYADGWRVLDAEGAELGSHELTHDHASEQPFTRTQSGLAIPEGVDEVTVEGRDLENGFGGRTVTVAVPRR